MPTDTLNPLVTNEHKGLASGDLVDLHVGDLSLTSPNFFGYRGHSFVKMLRDEATNVKVLRVSSPDDKEKYLYASFCIVELSKGGVWWAPYGAIKHSSVSKRGFKLSLYSRRTI